MPQSARIVATAIRDPFAVIRELGGDPQRICSSAGVDPTLLADSEATLPLASFVALIQRGSTELGLPHFGRLVGWRFDMMNLGEVGRAALSAPTLGAALRLVERAFAAVQGESELRLDVSGAQATLTYRILDGRIWPRDQDAELTLGVFASLIASVAGPGWRPVSFCFEHRPNGPPGKDRDGPTCSVTYEAPGNAFGLEARVLDLPMPLSDPGAFQPLSRTLSGVAHRIERGTSTETRVRRAVLRDLGRVPVDQDRIACMLGMSRRTLRRKLDEEGSGFARIVADCRDATACRLLGETTLSVQIIAERLGYSDATAFERAFARRTGQTAGGCRRAALAASQVRRPAGRERAAPA